MYSIASEFTDYVKKNKPKNADRILKEISKAFKDQFGNDPGHLSQLLLFHSEPGLSSSEFAERFRKSELDYAEEKILYDWLISLNKAELSSLARNVLEKFTDEYRRVHTNISTPSFIRGRLPERKQPLPKIEIKELPKTEEDWAIEGIDNPPKISDDETDKLIRFASIFSKSI